MIFDLKVCHFHVVVDKATEFAALEVVTCETVTLGLAACGIAAHEVAASETAALVPVASGLAATVP